MAFALGGVAFSIQHDANHNALGRRWRPLGLVMDVHSASLLGENAQQADAPAVQCRLSATQIGQRQCGLSIIDSNPIRTWHLLQDALKSSIRKSPIHAPARVVQATLALIRKVTNALPVETKIIEPTK